MASYSIRKSRKVLRTAYGIYKKKKERLSSTDQKKFESDLRALDRAVLDERKAEASTLAQRLEEFIKLHFPKTFFDHSRELVFALVFALVVAFFIRQFWFELYEVPTGSMRPTVEELDRIVVSKSTFGIQLPFRKKPVFYTDDYLNRNGIIVFTVADMDVADSDMLYFYLFPGKKRFIKRNVAKPGDTVYFYGGRIYSIDKEGNPVTELYDASVLKNLKIDRIDHIPYISMDGKPQLSQPLAQNVYASVTLKQMDLEVGKLTATSPREIKGQFFNGKEWVEDHPEALKAPHSQPQSYSDLWGIKNYAVTRLLTKEQTREFYQISSDNDETILYLELHHTPNLTYPKPEIRKGEMGQIYPTITPFTTVIPLKQNHIEALQKALFTARFCVEDGHAYRYTEGRQRAQHPSYDPKFPGVPNGCYEFYYGKGYKVQFGGILTALPSDHPLYNSSPDMLRKLFNLGIGIHNIYEPVAAMQPFYPQRFAYFRDGDLYVMGAPILKKSDPTLVRFVRDELEKQEKSSRQEPYIAFTDPGAPLKNGKIDVEFIKAFGLKVPETGVIALGDNYAMSADSRDFGFVPTENLRGAPSFTFWPIGSRVGPLPQPAYRWMTLPNLLVWTLAALIILGCILYYRRRDQKSVFED